MQSERNSVALPDRMPSTDWSGARGSYPALQRSAYFNYGAAGPLSQEALDAVIHAYELLERSGPFSIEANLWIEEEGALTRALLESELDALGGSIALVESICAACNVVLGSIRWQPGDHIAISASENAGVAAAVQSVAERFSLAVTRFPVSRRAAQDGAQEIERILRPQTRLVVLSHVLQATGELMPIAKIAQLCRSHRSSSRPMLLVDGAQAVGAIPVSLRSLDPDFYAFTGSKWWCGPAGLAGLYVRPELLENLQPAFAGWRGIGHSDARRLETGTSAYPLMAGLRTAVRLHAEAADIRFRHCSMLTMAAYFWSGLELLSQRTGIRIIPDAGPLPASGIVSFAIGGTRPMEVVRFLEARQILIREIDEPSCARACFHYFTTIEEIDELLKAIENFLTRRCANSPRGL